MFYSLFAREQGVLDVAQLLVINRR